jgi:hypothetical protein
MAGAPPQAGRMPFMPTVSLNQWSGALPKRGSCFPGKVFLRFASSSFCFRLFRQFNLLALSTSAVRTRAISLVLGLSFYPLERAPNMMIYAMSKSGTANERSNLSLRVLFAQAPIADARRCCQKIHLRTSGFKFQWGDPLLLLTGELSLYRVQCIIKPSFSGVVCPVDKRHK